MKPEYRSDIDGLRAIAVLLVVAFHAFPRSAPAGFVGVDIFFVISGFLISRLIYKDLHDGSFSLLDFYSRRIKRIFPALIVVLFVCAVVGAAILFQDEYQTLGKHIAYGAGFASNFLLLSEVGYFDGAAENKPLLHLWSLGIEEQFYLVWPALILLCARWKKDPFSVAAVICIGSFTWNVALSTADPNATFYLPVTRFWELMIGSMLASLTSQGGADAGGMLRSVPWFGYLNQHHRSMIVQGAAWLGVVLIVLSAALIDRERTFPGWWALLPTIGAALLIVGAPAAPLVRSMLSNRVLVYIGLISYPLYLWHWPLLSFARIVHIKEPTTLIKLAAVLAAFALAALTYRFIERPIRFGRSKSLKPIAAAVTLGVAGCVGALIYVKAGFPSRYSPELQTAIRAPMTLARFECEQDLERQETKVGIGCHAHDRDDARRVALWGDSHAASLSPGLEDARRRLGTFNLETYASTGCPPVIAFTSTQRPACKAFNESVVQRLDAWKPDMVVMAGRWELYHGLGSWGTLNDEAIRETISRLRSLGVGRVVVIGQLPVWFGAPWRIRARLLRMEPLRLFAGATRAPLQIRDKTYLRPATFQADEKVKKAVSGTDAIFISPLPTFCSEDGCLLVVRNEGEYLVARDAEGHLTIEGATFLVDANSKLIFGH